MKNKMFSIKEAVDHGWQMFLKNPSFFLQLMVITFLVQVVFTGMLERNLLVWLRVWLRTGSWLISLMISLGLINVALKAVDKKKFKLEDLYERVDLLVKYLLASLLYNLMVIFGLMLLIVPGIIWAVKYQYYGYLMVDEGLGIEEAFKKSSRLTKGIKLRLWWLGIVLAGINLLGFFALLIGLLISTPVTLLAKTYVYRRLNPKKKRK